MVVRLILVVRLTLVVRLKVVLAARVIDVGVVLHRTRGDVLCSGQWIRSGLEQRGRDRRGRARDNDLHRVVLRLYGDMGEAEMHTEPPIGIRDSCESKQKKMSGVTHRSISRASSALPRTGAVPKTTVCPVVCAKTKARQRRASVV